MWYFPTMIGKRALYWAPDFSAIHSMLFGTSDFSVIWHTVFAACDVLTMVEKRALLQALDFLAIQHIVWGIWFFSITAYSLCWSLRGLYFSFLPYHATALCLQITSVTCQYNVLFSMPVIFPFHDLKESSVFGTWLTSDCLGHSNSAIQFIVSAASCDIFQLW